MPVASFISDINIISLAFRGRFAKVKFLELAVDLDQAGELDVFLIQHDKIF